MTYHVFSDLPDKPVVNLAYANGFPPQTYARALSPLMDRYHVVSVHSRPLQGDCEPESLVNWRQLSDDLLEGLDAITDQPVIGIGHSLGGVVTLYAAIKRPERFSGLILIDPTMIQPLLLAMISLAQIVGGLNRSGLVQGALRRRQTWADREEAFVYFRSKRLFTHWSDEVLNDYVQSMTAPGEDGNVHLVWSPEWEAQIYRTMPLDVWSLPRQIKQPTMVLHGSLSNTFSRGSVMAFRLLRSDVKMVAVEGTGHLLPQEKPEEVGRLIADFVDGLAERPVAS